MSPELLQALILLIVGSGGTGAIGFLVKYLGTRKTGKLETQEHWVSKMTDQATRDAERVVAAEKRSDAAEAETDRFRELYFDQQAKSAYLTAFIRGLGHRPPRWPPDEEIEGGEPV